MSFAAFPRDAQPAPSQSSSTSPPSRAVSAAARPRALPLAGRPVSIGVVGDGRVARAFVALAEERAELLREREGVVLRLDAILARDPAKPRLDRRVGCDAGAFFARPFDVLVDAAGDPALGPPLARALARGTAVVTAGKELVAAEGPRLALLARATGATFGYEACVAAGLPLFRVLDDALRTTRVSSVVAVLNGTAAFVCARTAAGAGFAEAVREAQRLGLAEPDPTEDLSGRDAARKLAVLAWRLGARDLVVPTTTPLTAAALAALRDGPAGVPAHVARLELGPDGAVRRATVAPESLPAAHPLAGLREAENGLVLRGDVIERLVLRGPGAGPRPTAAALLDDVALAARRLAAKEVA